MSLSWLSETDAPLPDAARAYGAHGFAIFPCHGKTPLVERGLHAATTDEGQIRSWWARWPNANIAWVLPSGLFAVDEDPRHGGDFARTMLEKAHAPFPLTLRQLTGGGGFHWLFRHPANVNVRQVAGLVDGIDTRTAGRGYLLVAPSRHPDTGRIYKWQSVVDPVEAPPWLVALVKAVPATPAKPYTPPMRCHPRLLDRRRRYALAAVAGEARAVAEAPPGSRNCRLNRAWWRLAQFKDVLDRGEVERELLAAALAAGLSEREARRVLR
jgi:hypothetical protein